MRNRKWWWAYFIWAIGVAGVNAYKIYDALYDEEKKSKRPGLPPKWTHAEFLEELVYDFLLPGQTKKHVDLLRDIDNASLAASVRTTRSFSMYGSAGQSGEEEHDLSCVNGRKKAASILPLPPPPPCYHYRRAIDAATTAAAVRLLQPLLPTRYCRCRRAAKWLPPPPRYQAGLHRHRANSNAAATTVL
jgi:hypothetical protein